MNILIYLVVGRFRPIRRRIGERPGSFGISTVLQFPILSNVPCGDRTVRQKSCAMTMTMTMNPSTMARRLRICCRRQRHASEDFGSGPDCLSSSIRMALWRAAPQRATASLGVRFESPFRPTVHRPSRCKQSYEAKRSWLGRADLMFHVRAIRDDDRRC